ncbi:unnamed protein product [Closterium sp. NIES-65]|nr:unnamed protein product [Closterium sp. NIES-65]
MCMVSSPQYDGEKRVYSTPETGKWWEKLQAEVRKVDPEGVVAALILASDETHMDHRGKAKGHPMYLTLGNIDKDDRWKPYGHVLLALLPEYPPEYSSLDRTDVFHYVMNDVMAGLKRASHTGVKMKNAKGETIHVWPSVYAHITDYPESCKVTCTKSLGTTYPCSLCKVHKDELKRFEFRIKPRTPSEQNRVVQGMKRGTIDPETNEALSTHPVKSYLWGWRTRPTCMPPTPSLAPPNILCPITPSLPPHHGLCPVITSLPHPYLPCPIVPSLALVYFSAPPSHSLAIHPIPRPITHSLPPHHGLCPVITSLPHPYLPCPIVPSLALVYFSAPPSHSLAIHPIPRPITHSLHPHHGLCPIVMSLPHDYLPCPIVPSLSSRVFFSPTLAFSGHPSHSPPHHPFSAPTPWMLHGLREAFAQPSEWNFIKMHLISHYMDCIERAGLPEHYCAQLYEHLHIEFIKNPYRASNKRNVNAQVVQSEEMRLRIASLAPSLERKKKYDTAMVRAQRTGERILSRRSWCLHVPDTPESPPYVFPFAPQASRDVPLQNAIGPDLAHLRGALNAAPGCAGRGSEFKHINVSNVAPQ